MPFHENLPLVDWHDALLHCSRQTRPATYHNTTPSRSEVSCTLLPALRKDMRLGARTWRNYITCCWCVYDSLAEDVMFISLISRVDCEVSCWFSSCLTRVLKATSISIRHIRLMSLCVTGSARQLPTDLCPSGHSRALSDHDDCDVNRVSWIDWPLPERLAGSDWLPKWL